MFRILIVDDELLVRNHLKLLFTDLSSDFTICAEAGDGVTALHKIQETKPHIIISDMKMPDMDGLMLCQRVREQYPDIIFIALSNYDDYTYVRGALKNGALDYMLKHKLSKESLLSLLEDLKKTLNIKNDTKAFPDRSLSALREKFVADLLGQLFLSEEEIEANLKILGIRLDMTQVVPIILSIDDYVKLEQESNMKKRNILSFSICNIGNEILSNYPTGILTHMEQGIYCILLSFAHEASEAKRQETIHGLLHQLSSNYKNYLNISVSFCVGELSPQISGIGHSYAKALETTGLIFYSGKQSILHSSHLIPQPSELTGLDYSMEKTLLTLVLKGETIKTETLIKDLFQTMIDQKETRSNVQMKCTDLLSIITRISKKNQLDLGKIIAGKAAPDQIFIQLNTLPQLCQWFLDCFINMCGELNRQMPGDSSYVKAAIGYINRDYGGSVSLQSVAEEIGISAGYLSTIFKNETGQGFTEYLNSIRIASAVDMLELGERDFHKIAAESGFWDYAYFFKVFKKRMGTTPKTYLETVSGRR